MAYNNTDSNKKERLNVNTRGIQLMNSEGVLSKSTLVLGYWNEMISIKLHPMLPVESQGEFKKFNYDESISSALTMEKATTLLTFIKESQKSEEDRFFKGISVGADSLIGVGHVVQGDDKVTFLGLYKGLDPDTRIPKEKMLYEFRKIKVIENYDDQTGAFTSNEYLESELELLSKTLESAIEHLSNAATHADHYVDNYNRKRQQTTLNAIANKVGAETPYGARSNNGGGYQRNNRNGDMFGGSQSSKSDQVNERTIDNIDAISNLLG